MSDRTFTVAMLSVLAFALIAGTLDHKDKIAALRADLQKQAQIDQIPEKAAPAAVSAPSRTIYEAIRQVESGGWDGKLTGPDDNPTDIGPYQVTWPWWQDAFEGTDKATMADYRRYAFDPEICEIGMDRYWARYGAVTDEEKARCHHRGPNRARWYDERGDVYWAKVRGEMQ